MSSMSWSDFYLLCFLIGFSLSVISFLAGAVHLHLPFGMHFHLHGHGMHHAHAGAASKSSSHLSWFNATTLMAFLAWFGGTGYILTKKSHLVAFMSLNIALLSGALAGWLVFRFMSRLLKDGTGEMNEWDYREEGSVGTVSISIHASGTGEVIFEQHGIRRSAGARSDDGTAIAKGSEVVISRYENGIAYVKRWEEFTNSE
ncbi:MAG TPA: NfeD family protein [Candidatus Acidoferrum sp.]|nr:NfeD family protein [Candidatus Acidoferrum sp.]